MLKLIMPGRGVRQVDSEVEMPPEAEVTVRQ